MSEKFAANPVTGTGSLTVPIAISPGRGGFGPELTLHTTVVRATDPRCRDDMPSDPSPGTPTRLPATSTTRSPTSSSSRAQRTSSRCSNGSVYGGSSATSPTGVGDDRFTVRRYRPRFDGLFARIERWTNDEPGDVHWRSITKDNVTTLFGTGVRQSRLRPSSPQRRVFSWLMAQTTTVAATSSSTSTRRRTRDYHRRSLRSATARSRTRGAERYLKRIKYGGVTPYHPANGGALPTAGCLRSSSTTGRATMTRCRQRSDRELVRAAINAAWQWPVREDPFSPLPPWVRGSDLPPLPPHPDGPPRPRGSPGEQPHDGLVSATEFGRRVAVATT